MHHGFALHGPWEPSQGHLFNPAKLLIDPCATAWTVSLKMTRCSMLAMASLTTATAPVAPKSVVVHDLYDWEDDAPPQTPWGQHRYL